MLTAKVNKVANVRSIFFGGYCPEEFQRIAHSFVHLWDSGQTLLKPGDIIPVSASAWLFVRG